MIKVGITGGIGSGKSLVCNIFRTMDIPVYDADTRAKALMNEDKKIINALISKFGSEVYINGILNRQFLAGEIFKNKDAVEFVNGIVHPAVKQDFINWISTINNVPYILKEAALLFESGSYKELDYIITVSCPEEIRIKRVILRDNTTYDKVIERINNQWPETDKVNKSHFVITNDDRSSLIEQIILIHKNLTEK